MKRVLNRVPLFTVLFVAFFLFFVSTSSAEFIDSGQLLGNSYSSGVALGDVDGDGDLDAFIANAAGQPNKVWLNDYKLPHVTVEIDIKPSSDPNCFNNDGHGVIPIAILGSADFNVNDIEPESIKLEALSIKAVGKNEKLLSHYEDVNDNGYEDLIAQIEDVDGNFSEGDTTAKLTGNLYDGTLIEGTDSICIVP